MKKNKAFTLIELIAVLVILAILALIVTPLVMNIIKKARISADKRSIDAYGRSIELAIASYLLDEGKFPTSISDLTIEYSGDEVVCSTTQLNPDSSVYLTGCTVAGRSVDYTYGNEQVITYKAYSVGDEVSYNNVDYYVLADSGTSEESVTLLKAEPLTVLEVNEYGAGNINRYTYDSVGTAFDKNGYGGIAYYTSETCGYVENWVSTGCTSSYELSDIKYVVDGWKNSKAPLATEARLIKKEEIEIEIREYDPCGGCGAVVAGECAKYDWLYNSNYWYWTMSPYNDSSSEVWRVNETSRLDHGYVGILGGSNHGVVRPVITISKKLISSNS